MATLGTMQPTSEFGALFQYSNPMAAAAGFLGGHVLFPEAALGEAYDRAMRAEVFEPLGMASTTFDFAEALAGDHALPYAPDIDGDVAPAVMGISSDLLPAETELVVMCARISALDTRPGGRPTSRTPFGLELPIYDPPWRWP